MRITIDISDEMYKSVLDGTYCGVLYEELKNGTPLPKGHGRLIDIDDVSLQKTIECGGLSAKALWRRIKQQPTIVEADKE